MKVFVKLVILFLILACVGPFFIKNKNGQPLLKIEDISFPGLPSLAEISSKAKPILQLGSSEQNNHSDSFKAYKWKDKNGVMHYSDKNNPGGNNQLTKIKDISILPVYKTDSKKQAKLPDSTSTNKLPSLTTIPLQQIPKLIDDAKQVKNLLENRKMHQGQILDQSQ